MSPVILVFLGVGHHYLMLTSSSRRLRTLSDANIVAFATAPEGCDENTHTSANDEDFDARRRITMHIAVSVHRNGAVMGEFQCLLKASHD